jgi:hypothetical protein
MPSVMDERHEEIRSASISSDHLSEKPVFGNLPKTQIALNSSMSAKAY